MFFVPSQSADGTTEGKMRHLSLHMSDWFLLAFEVAPLRYDDDDVDGGLTGWWKHEASPFVGCFQKNVFAYT